MYRLIVAAAAAVAFATATVPAAAQSWTFTSWENQPSVASRCAGGLPCSPYGFQRDWVVPQDGRYKVTLAGGEGGAGYESYWGGEAYINTKVAGGAGAVVSGIYNLSSGTQLVIVGGQAGQAAFLGSNGNSFGGGGGGGGSFVFSVPQLKLAIYDGQLKSFDLGASTLLAAAGGGGGTTTVNVAPGLTTGSLFDYLGIETGGAGLAGRDGGMTFRTINGVRGPNSLAGGVNGGLAGRVWNPYDNVPGDYNPCTNSGASYRGNTGDLCQNSIIDFAHSAERGFQGTPVFGTSGGFAGFGGGAAGTKSNNSSVWYGIGISGGGGGGYSGGGGGLGLSFIGGSGGGGGSYISDNAIFVSGLSGANRGNGYVTIEFLAGVPEPASWAMLIIGFGMVGATARKRNTVVLD